MEGTKLTEMMRSVMTAASYYTISKMVQEKTIPVNATGAGVFQMGVIFAIITVVTMAAAYINRLLPAAVQRYPFITVMCLLAQDSLTYMLIPLQQLAGIFTGELSASINSTAAISPFQLIIFIYIIWILYRAYNWRVEIH
jgi:hypothetical protein